MQQRQTVSTNKQYLSETFGELQTLNTDTSMEGVLHGSEMLISSDTCGGDLIAGLTDPLPTPLSSSLPTDISQLSFESEDATALQPQQPSQTENWEDIVLSAALPYESDRMPTNISSAEVSAFQPTLQLLSRSPSHAAGQQLWRSSQSLYTPNQLSSFSSNSPGACPGRTFSGQHHQLLDEDLQSKISTMRSFIRTVDCTEIMTALMLAKNPFFQMLPHVASHKSLRSNASFVDRAGAEFLELLSENLDASLSATRELATSWKHQEGIWGPLFHNKLLTARWKANKPKADSDNRELTQSFKPSKRAKFIECTNAGRMIMDLKNETCPGFINRAVLDITFIPEEGICESGLVARFSQINDKRDRPRMTRSLVPINIIPYSSPFFIAVREGDIRKVRELLLSGNASIYDRLPEGNSPLQVSQRNPSCYQSELILCSTYIDL